MASRISASGSWPGGGDALDRLPRSGRGGGLTAVSTLTITSTFLLKRQAQTMQFPDSESREKMILANVGLVRRMAARFRRSAPFVFEDLVAEGHLGLIHAVDTFDPTRGVVFSTHAEFSIRAAMQRVVNGERRYRRFAALSLEQLIGAEEEGRSLGEMVAGGEGRELEEVAVRATLREVVAEALKALSPGQKAALTLRFGLNGCAPLSFAETARRLHMTEARLTQVLARAQEILRRHLRGTYL